MWSISNGMKQQEVFRVMSEGGWKPYDRSFSGNNEAWLYCKDGTTFWRESAANKTVPATFKFIERIVILIKEEKI
jgi:hypothetical protein